MARIRQIGPGRRTNGTIDGVTYVVRNGKTYVRATPIMPAKAYTTPAALKRRAIFKMIQKHLKYHRRTLKQTFTPSGNGTATTTYYSENKLALKAALSSLADRMVAGEIVTLNDVESAICAYATEHPGKIMIGHLMGYEDVFLTGDWPSTITLNATTGDSTVVIIVAENGTTTTIQPNGTTSVEAGQTGSTEGGSSSGSETGGSGSGSGSGSSTGSETSIVTAPTISGTTPFEETTTVTISGPAQATIYYTLDGSTPTSSSTQYSEPLTLSNTTTIKAIAVKDGVSSSVSTRTFTKSSGGGNASEG